VVDIADILLVQSLDKPSFGMTLIFEVALFRIGLVEVVGTTAASIDPAE
jgi:hypothetical protein